MAVGLSKHWNFVTIIHKRRSRPTGTRDYSAQTIRHARLPQDGQCGDCEVVVFQPKGLTNDQWCSVCGRVSVDVPTDYLGARQRWPRRTVLLEASVVIFSLLAAGFWMGSASGRAVDFLRFWKPVRLVEPQDLPAFRRVGTHGRHFAPAWQHLPKPRSTSYRTRCWRSDGTRLQSRSTCGGRQIIDYVGSIIVHY